MSFLAGVGVGLVLGVLATVFGIGLVLAARDRSRVENRDGHV